MDVRKCKNCGPQPFDQFRIYPKPDGKFRFVCIKCSRSQKIARRERNPEKYRASDRAYQKEHRDIYRCSAKRTSINNKRACIEHYGGPSPMCECCKKDTYEFLTLDHIGGGGNAHKREINRQGNTLYGWLKKNNFPSGFRVLCHCCNFSFGAYGYCPHSSLSQFEGL